MGTLPEHEKHGDLAREQHRIEIHVSAKSCLRSDLPGHVISPPVSVIVMATDKNGLANARVDAWRSGCGEDQLHVDNGAGEGQWIFLRQLQLWNHNGLILFVPEELRTEATGEQPEIKVDRGRRKIVIAIGMVLAAAAAVVGTCAVLPGKKGEPDKVPGNKKKRPYGPPRLE